MKSQRAVHCWVLLAGYSAYGKLNILTPGILSINLLWIWNSDELSDGFTSPLWKKLRKGSERLLILRQVDDRNFCWWEIQIEIIRVKRWTWPREILFFLSSPEGEKNKLEVCVWWSWSGVHTIKGHTGYRRKDFSGDVGETQVKDWPSMFCPPGRHLSGGLKDVRGREEDQKDLVVTLCLFKWMDKVRRKEARRGEGDHKDLYYLGL